MEQTLDDYKCCGNCKHTIYQDFTTYYEGTCSNKKCEPDDIMPNLGSDCCLFWEYDGLTREDREI